MILFAMIASALPVMAAYFYRRRSNVIVVPAVDDWMRIGRPVQTRSVAALLRSLISLSVQLLLIALVALALRELAGTKVVPRKIALVIDVGATMQTREAAGTRFDLAREAAKKRLAEQSDNCQFFLVAAAHHPLVAHASGIDKQQALREIDALEPLDVESDLFAAVRSAATFVARDPAAETIVLSDFSDSPPAAIRNRWNDVGVLTLSPVGSDHPNAAITNFGCERSETGATITARGLDDQTAAIEIRSEGKAVWNQNVRFVNGQATVRAQVALAPLTPFELVVDAHDSLAADDRVFGVTPPARKGVCLITRGNVALERALRADPSVPLRIIPTEQFQPSDEVLVIDGVDLPNLSDQAPCLFIAAPDPRAQQVLSSPIDPGDVAHWIDHPTLRDVAPDLIHVRLASLSQSKAGELIPILNAAKAPLILERVKQDDSAAPRSIVWLFRIEETDLATRPTFPVLLWNTLDYLSGEDLAAAELSGQTGKPLKVPDAASAIDPVGRQLALKRVGDHNVADALHAGIYTISQRPVAVNLISERGLRPLVHVDSKPPARAQTPRWNWRDRPNWEIVAAAALIVVLAEWLLFQRGFLRVA